MLEDPLASTVHLFKLKAEPSALNGALHYPVMWYNWIGCDRLECVCVCVHCVCVCLSACVAYVGTVFAIMCFVFLIVSFTVQSSIIPVSICTGLFI